MSARIWTRLMAGKVFNDGTDRPIRSADIRPAGTPSPYQGELKGE